MNVHPSCAPAERFNRKDFWLAAYLAALHRLPADDAVADADQALRRADQRWENAPTIGSWRYEHEYPVGSTFGHADEPQ